MESKIKKIENGVTEYDLEINWGIIGTKYVSVY